MYLTIDGKLTIEQNSFSQIRFNNTQRLKLLIFAYFFVFVLNYFIEKLNVLKTDNGFIPWLLLIFSGSLLVGFIFMAVDYMLNRSFAKKVSISNVKKIQMYSNDHNVETEVKLTLKNKRIKKYYFRTLENQAKPFVQELKNIHPAIQIEWN